MFWTWHILTLKNILKKFLTIWKISKLIIELLHKKWKTYFGYQEYLSTSLKNNSKWVDKQYGDYNYFKPLFDNTNENDKFFFDYTLTATQFDDKIGNFGK